MQHWNKNAIAMRDTGKQYFLKHQHHYSYTTTHSKRGALIGTWVRMDTNTSLPTQLQEAIDEKVIELKTIGYPLKQIKRTLKHMHNKTGDEFWSRVMEETH